MNSKKWVKIFFIIMITLLFLVATTVLVIDPYCHFHKPLNFLAYRLENGQYTNNGLLRQYEYDSIITGVSHSSNFKVSQFNELFNCNSIKVPLSGTEFKELADQLKMIINYKPDLKYVLYGLNYMDILHDKDLQTYPEYPTYLYDDDILNDCRYLFSGPVLKKIFKDVILFTLTNHKTTNFDEYDSWEYYKTLDGENIAELYSKESALEDYDRKEAVPDNEISGLNDEEKNKVMENFNQNLIDIIKDNPNIKFYLFLAPHSIVFWDSAKQSGNIQKYLEAEEILINNLLEFSNVKLFSFFNNYDLICNLDNYMDVEHYSGKISEQILNWIKNDEYLITKENKEDYLKSERNFYLNYDYDKLFNN